MKNILYQESIVEIKHLFRMMRNTRLALFVFAGTAFATESYSQTMKVLSLIHILGRVHSLSSFPFFAFSHLSRAARHSSNVGLTQENNSLSIDVYKRQPLPIGEREVPPVLHGGG